MVYNTDVDFLNYLARLEADIESMWAPQYKRSRKKVADYAKVEVCLIKTYVVTSRFLARWWVELEVKRRDIEEVVASRRELDVGAHCISISTFELICKKT